MEKCKWTYCSGKKKWYCGVLVSAEPDYWKTGCDNIIESYSAQAEITWNYCPWCGKRMEVENWIKYPGSIEK